MHIVIKLLNVLYLRNQTFMQRENRILSVDWT